MPTYRTRKDQLSWREVDGEVVLLDERDWTYLHLNGTGALLWASLGEGDGATLDQLVDALVAEFDVDRDVAAADTRALLDDFVARELVVGE